MKFIQTIIAFLSVYLFLGAVFFVICTFIWLNGYMPDMPTHQIAKVVMSASANNTRIVTYKKHTGVTALTTVFSRGAVPTGKDIGQVEFTSNAGFVEYKTMKVPERFVPIGFKQLVKLSKITDATGKVVYEDNPGVLDKLFDYFFSKVAKSTIIVPLVATDKATTYTIILSDDGVNTYEN